MSHSSFETLSKEVDQLGRLIGDVIREMDGDEGFELVESVRKMIRELRGGNRDREKELDSIISDVDKAQIITLTRAFTIFLELSNLAEDRQRVRVLHDRRMNAYPEPAKETIRAIIKGFHDRGYTDQQVQQFVNQARVELVLTAHPTEAKRRSIRRLLNDLRKLLDSQDSHDLLPYKRERIPGEVKAQIRKLWQTDFIRSRRPTVLQEVQRGLAYKDVLWEVVPRVANDLRQALADYYPAVKKTNPLFIYGSWIGGDRDGNPFVTPDVTAQTFEWLREAALETHLNQCKKLGRSLCISDKHSEAGRMILDSVASAKKRWPDLESLLQRVPPRESYRQWLRVIHWRLSQTATLGMTDRVSNIPGAYMSAAELHSDLTLIRNSLRTTGNSIIAEKEVQPWLDQIRIFGFHMMHLDIRQDSSVYAEVMNDIWKVTGKHDDPANLAEMQRQELLQSTLGSEIPAERSIFEEPTQRTLELFTVMRRTARVYGMAALGAHVVSMTRTPSDLLTVLWLWKWSESVDGGDEQDSLSQLPLVPLFETIEDLRNADATLTSLLSDSVYREYLKQQGDNQTIMIGYSDSTKDGGYLAGQWGLYNSQSRMAKVAKESGINLTFFHGRGGSLGRGGGPAAKSVLSLPEDSFNGTLRLTEQGEILSDRYDNPHIASRHLEQLAWAVLAKISDDSTINLSPWQETIQQLADRSRVAYRQLVDHPGFPDFYRHVTPINQIEKLPIGSRPSKRRKGDKVENLRAIPWVFSWTQCRCLIPAWFGIGSACKQFVDTGEFETLQGMYDEWTFFKAIIDNAALALAKTNMPVFSRYAQLGADLEGGSELIEMINTEYENTLNAILKLTGSEQLLDKVGWLYRSIDVRNGYVGPLNLLQIELMKRCAAASEDDSPEYLSDLDYQTQLTIKGVSTGMRGTG
ncbi:MAG: phosphoenolpyruvate carboxylase [Planctomycetaceae bacterium]|nr:phosphoenolpyruvate carboxylase [Planctomycetaceae bacterium]